MLQAHNGKVDSEMHEIGVLFGRPGHIAPASNSTNRCPTAEVTRRRRAPCTRGQCRPR
jgi:hypothetical protein